jgi:polyisoprenoid-binding protein YceI
VRKQYLVLAALALSCTVLGATAWKNDPRQSALLFYGTQAGAEFEGEFRQFTAEVDFDPDVLATSRLDVTIEMKSADTRDRERDEILHGKDLFDTERWPTAHYVADTFTDERGGSFRGTGKLTIRDVTRDVPIEFIYRADATGALLKGHATLRRLDFGVGQGDWRDTEWVGNDVRVEFSLKLQH